MKIPRDAARPKLEDLVALAEEISSLPFQPEEEDILSRIIENAQTFRDHIARYCNPLLSTEAESETHRFYLRKLEGAEVLLAFETNFFRQELHKWCPVAPEAPLILEVSLSTRKPRPTKLQKMLAEYGVDNPDDLPEHAKGKANSLRRKAANAEAAAAAAAAAAAQSTSGMMPPSNSAVYGSPTFHAAPSQPRGAGAAPAQGQAPKPAPASHKERPKGEGPEADRGLHLGFLGAGGPQLLVDSSSLTLEERLLQGREDGINLHTEAGKSKALEILGRTEVGRKQAEDIWGSDVWRPTRRSMSGEGDSMTPREVDGMMRQDEGSVDDMFKEMTNQEDEEDSRKDSAASGPVTSESLESERNGMDALLDGE